MDFYTDLHLKKYKKSNKLIYLILAILTIAFLALVVILMLKRYNIGIFLTRIILTSITFLFLSFLLIEIENIVQNYKIINLYKDLKKPYENKKIMLKRIGKIQNHFGLAFRELFFIENHYEVCYYLLDGFDDSQFIIGNVISFSVSRNIITGVMGND